MNGKSPQGVDEFLRRGLFNRLHEQCLVVEEAEPLSRDIPERIVFVLLNRMSAQRVECKFSSRIP